MRRIVMYSSRKIFSIKVFLAFSLLTFSGALLIAAEPVQMTFYGRIIDQSN